MIKLSDYVAKRLKEVYNVSNIFLISGGGAMHLNDSFARFIPYTTAHNEQALAMMAEGYSRVKRDLAVVNVTTGPGGLNCLNGVFGQWTDSVPVLYISGQVKYSTTIDFCKDINLRQLGDQEVDIINVVKHLTKYAVMVKDPKTIKYHLDRAIYEATNGRYGPVWLDIPIDVQGSIINENELKSFESPKDHFYDYNIEEVLNRLSNSERPVIIAGHGIRLSGREKIFYDLVDKLSVPILSTFLGMDIIQSSHPLYFGRIGSVGQRAANFILQNADLILCLGTRNSIFSISYNYENFAKNAYKIIIDIDEAELNKPTLKPDLSINADLKYFLPDLLKKSKELNVKDWIKWCIDRKSIFSFENTIEYHTKKDRINPYNFVYKLTRLMKNEDIMVTGNGSACVITYQTAEVKYGERIFWNKGDASMGYGLPASIGASIASIEMKNKNNIICLEGDGSIMMNIQELQTIKHYNLPIKIFIINNNGYISIIQTQNNIFEGRKVGCSINSGVSMPDFLSVAKSFKIDALEISLEDTMEEQIKEVLNKKSAVVCNVIVDDNYSFSPKLSAKKLDDGTIVSPSLEDMAPFLDRDDFYRHMIK